MPNHVTNIVVARKEVIDALLNEKGRVDFERIIPMPEIIYRGALSFEDEIRLQGRDWYNWSIANWGTKWNAYDSERLSDTKVQFDTAWSHPALVIIALSFLFPEDTISVIYADEDLGYNLGEYTIRNGTYLCEALFVEGSPDALDFAASIKYNKTYQELRDEWDAEDALDTSV